MRRTLSISILVDRLPERAQVIFNLVGLALGTAILAVLTWTGASYAWEMWVEHELADVFEWPIAPFRFAWAFGCLLFLIVLVARLVVEVRKTVDVWSR
jgi:TRAP-type C4-dicarboxylate transport system permease small subunit